MQIFITAPARKDNKRAAATSLLAWLALMLIVAVAFGMVTLRNTAAAGTASDTTQLFFAPMQPSCLQPPMENRA